MKLNENERKVLDCLLSTYSYEGLGYRCFASVMAETGIDRKAVRRACRSLARKGLAEYSCGLWNDEGKPAGAGYAATKMAMEPRS